MAGPLQPAASHTLAAVDANLRAEFEHGFGREEAAQLNRACDNDPSPLIENACCNAGTNSKLERARD